MEQQLLDFRQRLDVTLLDATVAAFYGTSSEDERAAAKWVLTTLQEHPETWTRVVALLQACQNFESTSVGLQQRPFVPDADRLSAWASSVPPTTLVLFPEEFPPADVDRGSAAAKENGSEEWLQSRAELAPERVFCPDNDSSRGVQQDASPGFHPNVSYRRIQPSDLTVLQELHENIFPIVYEQEFFSNAVHGRGIVAWAAVDDMDPSSLVGFLTARIVDVKQGEDCDVLAAEDLEGSRSLVYVLTLGVVRGYRHLGIGSSLIRKVTEFAASSASCRAVYLHVIGYNHGGIRLYEKNRFTCLKELPQFYHIQQRYYNALLYIFYVNGGRPPRSSFIAGAIAAARSIFKALSTVIGRLLAPSAETDAASPYPNHQSKKGFDAVDGSEEDFVYTLEEEP